MKKFFLLFVAFIFLKSSFSQVLFTYGDNTVTKDEFLRAYNKNNTKNDYSEKSLKEYVDLYSKFKLKVKAAQNLQIDTSQQLQSDMQNFRSQIEEGYLTDEKEVQNLVNEAVDRSQKDIRVTHLYVPVNPFMSVQDSTAAYKAINDFYKEISKGNKNYKTIAADLTMKYKLNIKASDLGFITVFSIPYEYENIVYGLKEGTYCKPYRSKNAWHIFINEAIRKPFGKWKAAQILFLFPPNSSQAQKENIKSRADSIYNLLINGNDFVALARQYSDDRFSYQTGGEMQEFGVGKFSLDFEDKLAELKNDGDISKPILMSDGYHILKRIKQTLPVSDKTNEANINAVKKAVQSDARIDVAKQKFIKDDLQKISFTKMKDVNEAGLLQYADSVVNLNKTVSTPFDSVNIFSVGKNTIFKGADWYRYVKSKRQPLSPKMESNEDVYSKFISVTALDYYKKHLEEYNTDFKYQMQEFRDGNMLFEIMERKVWTKASADSVGLMEQYLQNKTKYLWNASADVIIFNCSNKDVADKAIQSLQSGKSWSQLATESNASIQADSGRYELSQLSLPADVKLTEKYLSPVSVNSQDKTVNFVYVIKIYPANQQRSFNEAKGMVINDYQNYLEEKWINELKIQYPVKVNGRVFKSLIK